MLRDEKWREVNSIMYKKEKVYVVIFWKYNNYVIYFS